MSMQEKLLNRRPSDLLRSRFSGASLSKLRSASEFGVGRGRTTSVEILLTSAEIKGIRHALDEMEKQKGEVEAEGLSRLSFFAGIVNVVITTCIFCKWPADLWIFYGIECAVFIPIWWFKMSREENGIFYIMDFCWFTSTFFGLYMFLSFFKMVPPEWQRSAFIVFFSCGLGPMSWACVILFAGLVFHSLEKTASLFIHYTPTLVTYALLSNAGEVATRWPGRFPEMDELGFETLHTYESPMPEWCFYADEVFLHGWRFYFAWWLLHSAWLLSIGVDLRAKGYSTVFHNIYERANLGEVLSKMTGLTTIRSHAAIYLLAHLAASSFSFFWAPMCFRNSGVLGGIIAGSSGGAVTGAVVGHPLVGALLGGILCGTVGHWMSTHLLWIAVVFLSAVWMGAGHYDFIFAQKYTKAIARILDEFEQ